MSEKKLDIKTIEEELGREATKLNKYSLVLFILFIALIYGFVLFRINSLSHAEPSTTAISSQVKTTHVAHIDESVVKQLESLQDNSVSVQALFDQARSNPFQ